MTIIVANTRTHPTGDPRAVYIGRGGRNGPASPLGNPYRIGRNGTREDCVAQYAAWLDAQLARPDSVAAREFARLRALVVAGDDLTLVCFCAPLLCHGNVIKARLELALARP